MMLDCMSNLTKVLGLDNEISLLENGNGPN